MRLFTTASRPRRIALAATAALLTLGLAEGGLRLFLRLRWGTSDVYTKQEIYRPHPLCAYIPRENLDQRILGRFHVVTDEDGFRNQALSPRPEAGVLRIAFLGGSTTFSTYVSGNAQAYPQQTAAQLQQHLQGSGYRRVEALNAGVPAYTTRESLHRYLAQVRFRAPHWVVIYHAINDVGALGRPDARADYSHLQRRLHQPGLLDHLRLVQAVRWRWQPQDFYATPAPLGPARPPLDEAAAAPYRDNLRQLIAAIHCSGARPILVAFATRDPDPDVNTLNRVLIDLARETDTACYERFPQDFADPQDFVDHCHVHDAGAAKKGRLISGFLRTLLSR